MRSSAIAGCITVLSMFLPAAAVAQTASPLVLGAGVGGTFYGISTRTNTGTALVGLVGYDLGPNLMIEAGVRRHQCVDCDRFLIAEGGLHLKYPGRTFSPYVAGGYGVVSDPEFMGTEHGLHAAVGVWLWPERPWGLRTEVRGRQAGKGDGMGEASVLLTRRLPGRRR